MISIFLDRSFGLLDDTSGKDYNGNIFIELNLSR